MTQPLGLNKFSINIGSPLVIELSGSKHVFKTSFVGFKSAEYIVFEKPETNGADVIIQEGNLIIGAFISSGTVIRFKCQILHHIAEPVPLVIASFPESLSGHDLRKSKRVECNVPATLRLYHGIAQHDGIIVDISSGGCKYVASSMPKEKVQCSYPGGKVGLTFQFLGAEGHKNITGDIVSVNQEGKKLTIGMKFHKAEDEVLGKIAEYVEKVAKSLL
jgi:c-di-GMP-binding flagellar brake protein YcgR